MLSSATAENLACTDEVKVYEDEGEEEEQQKSSENLTEDKVRLVIESETQTDPLYTGVVRGAVICGSITIWL
ncbi:uncharacterized protein DEA37_0008821 [Paragonimus westermani]|uniref:Uncharacterized protein n=1 Tax=Paragonimus westermani TaxID=34504 RepID=A0A5J4NLF7_9TREM|nr:uncharacterized protein DEA37_0008821 [Paragonimus westermani]